MDRDTGSIGGIKDPLQPARQLFYTTIVMDAVALLLSSCISWYFAVGILAYITASRAYSYRGIRLKKYPVAGYITVIFFQGAVTFFLVMHGSSADKTLHIPFTDMLAASLLIGGFYPLTQIYQHKQDEEDGVTTLSMLLGYKGTFIFTAIIYFSAMAVLAYQLTETSQWKGFIMVQFFLLPVLIYFFWWFRQVYYNLSAANFVNTMRMNILASVCTNAAFITFFITGRIWPK